MIIGCNGRTLKLVQRGSGPESGEIEVEVKLNEREKVVWAIGFGIRVVFEVGQIW